MTDSVTFSSFELTVGGAFPNDVFLNKAFSPDKENTSFDQELHQIERDIIDERFYWFYSNYGKAMPHRDIVVDTQSLEESENPRTSQQVEPNKQLFAIYDKDSTLFYISNIQKKSLLEEYLKGHTDEEVIIKNVYKNISEFIDEISSLESIKFTGSRDLLNREGDLFQQLRDIFGYGEPEEFSIEAKYRTSMTDVIKREIMRLAGYQGSNKQDIKTLVCIGKNERGFERVFNTNSFINKIPIPLQKDTQLLFPPEEVKNQAIIKLKEMLNV